jgi:hypothetical protein
MEDVLGPARQGGERLGTLHDVTCDLICEAGIDAARFSQQLGQDLVTVFDPAGRIRFGHARPHRRGRLDGQRVVGAASRRCPSSTGSTIVGYADRVSHRRALLPVTAGRPLPGRIPVDGVQRGTLWCTWASTASSKGCPARGPSRACPPTSIGERGSPRSQRGRRSTGVQVLRRRLRAGLRHGDPHLVLRVPTFAPLMSTASPRPTGRGVSSRVRRLDMKSVGSVGWAMAS